jgi:CubicO group peptidase (beta-lactamase class C family)
VNFRYALGGLLWLGVACGGSGAESTAAPSGGAEDPTAEVAAEPLPDGLDYRVQEYVAQFGRNWPAFRFHGAILVARGETVGVQQAFGQAQLVEGLNNRPDTRFRLGTLSAPIAAVVILRLAEDGRLKLTDEITQYLPELPLAKGITVEQLLSHRSGLPSFTDNVVFPKWKTERHAAEQTLQLVVDSPPDIDPGSDVWPSNTNYLLLGLIAERVTEQPFDALAQTLVLSPAKMTATTYGDADLPVATGMQFNEAEALDIVREVEPLTFGAAGAFVSTTGDLHRFMRALHDGTLLQPASRDRLFGRTPEDPGYGFVPDVRFGRRVLTWPGLLDGFNGSLVHFPQDETTIIVLANSEVVPAGLLASEVASMTYGGEPNAWDELRPAPVPIDEQRTAVGNYELTEGSLERLLSSADPRAVAELEKISVQRTGDFLVLDVPGHARRRMHPLDPQRFFFKDVGGTRAEARVGPDGQPRLLVQQRGGPQIVFAFANPPVVSDK